MFPVIDKRETGINLSRIMTMRGITAKNVQDYLNLGCVQSVYRWLDGVNMPSIDNLYALSEFFRCRLMKLCVATRNALFLRLMLNRWIVKRKDYLCTMIN